MLNRPRVIVWKPLQPGSHCSLEATAWPKDAVLVTAAARWPAPR
ncbi:MAG: hypothetical protein ACR2N1_01605 [Rubripirellula sp.]